MKSLKGKIKGSRLEPFARFINQKIKNDKFAVVKSLFQVALRFKKMREAVDRLSDWTVLIHLRSPISLAC